MSVIVCNKMDVCISVNFDDIQKFSKPLKNGDVTISIDTKFTLSFDHNVNMVKTFINSSGRSWYTPTLAEARFIIEDLMTNQI